MNSRLKLVYRGGTPPGGWWFLHSTGVRIEGSSFSELFDRVYRHYLHNGLPVPQDLAVLVEDQVAQRVAFNDPELVTPVDAPPAGTALPYAYPPAPRRWGWEDITRFAATMAGWIASGGKRVSEAEAEARAVICADCPENGPMSECPPCKAVPVKTLIATLSGGKTSKDEQLQLCRVCGCLNKAQIWFPLELLRSHLAPDMMDRLPQSCWKKLQGAGVAVETHKLDPGGATPPPAPKTKTRKIPILFKEPKAKK